MTRIIVRRAKIVPNFMGECQLRNFRRHATVIINEGNDARVKAPLGSTWITGHVLRVGLVAFTYAARSAGR